MTALTELFACDDMNKLKHELARLIESKDYKTVNTLLKEYKISPLERVTYCISANSKNEVKICISIQK